MSSDIYYQEVYTHKSGKKYHVKWLYDNDRGSPLEDSDGFGVVERMDWNPTDEEQLEQHIVDNEPELEEETRLRLMRVLHGRDRRRDSGLYYDFLSSMHKAQCDWGVEPDRVQEVVEKDFEYLSGYYNEDWFWLVLSVAPLDEDDEPIEDDREYIGGYESTILNDDEDNRECREDAINNIILELEYVRRSRLHAGQLELCFA